MCYDRNAAVLQNRLRLGNTGILWLEGRSIIYVTWMNSSTESKLDSIMVTAGAMTMKWSLLRL